MQTISHDNLYYQLPQVLLLLLTLAGIVFFVPVIRSRGEQKLVSYTRWMSAFYAMVFMIAYTGINVTDYAPVRMVLVLPEISFYIIARVLLIIFYLVFFLMARGAGSRKTAKLFWTIILLFNLFDIVRITWYYVTWTQPATMVSPVDIILTHMYTYSFSRYISNLLLPVTWAALAWFAFSKLRRLPQKTGVAG